MASTTRAGYVSERSGRLTEKAPGPHVLAKRGAGRTPLPWAQLAIIFAIKLSIPLTTQQTSPYFNELLARVLNRPSNEIGYYTGLLSALSHIPQIASAYPWGRISDRVGRRLPIFACLFVLIVATMLLGIANTFSLVILSRMLVGLATGAVGAMHSVVGDLTDESNASNAFPLYDTVSAVGFAIGPLIGGLLAHPAEGFPSVFQDPFWLRYPYLLPSLVTSLYAFGAASLSLGVLKETNPRAARQVNYQPLPDAERQTEQHEPPPGAKELLLAYPMLRYITASSGAIGITAAAFNVFFVLLAYSNIADGGLQLKPAKIGVVLSSMGLLSIPLKLSLPFILTRWSTLAVFRVTLRAWPVTFAALPLLSLLVRTLDSQRTSAQEALLWVAILVVLFLSRVGSMSFGLIILLVKEHTPEAAALGALNGITELAQMAGILIGPPIITSLFAYSITNNVIGGYLWAIVIIPLSIGLASIGDVMIRHEAAMARAARDRVD